jgi:hypothetical protein
MATSTGNRLKKKGPLRPFTAASELFHSPYSTTPPLNMPVGTRASNANKHPGYIVKPPAKPRSTPAQVEAKKVEKAASAAAVVAAKEAALCNTARLEAER